MSNPISNAVAEEEIVEVSVREVMRNEAGERGIFCFDVTACIWATDSYID